MLPSPLVPMNDRKLMFARRLVGVARKMAIPVLSLAGSLLLSGCPGGADLENPYFAGGASAGGSSGTGVGAGTSGTAGTAGDATGGTAGTAGTGMVVTPASCDVDITDALSQNCARQGCHNAVDHYANLILKDPNAIAAQMVGIPATHGDINCSPPGVLYRACDATEIATICPPGELLIDPQNFANSWVVKKLTPGATAGCGDDMPLSPGNSVNLGWDANGQRRQCFLDFFQSLAAAQ